MCNRVYFNFNSKSLTKQIHTRGFPSLKYTLIHADTHSWTRLFPLEKCDYQKYTLVFFTRVWQGGPWSLGPGPWALVPWSRALGPGPLVPGPGPWSPGPGPWARALGLGPMVPSPGPGPMVPGPWALVQWPRALGPPGCSHIVAILIPGQLYRGYSCPGPAIP